MTFESTGAAPKTVGVSGTGVLPTPILTVTPTTLNFPSTAVGAGSPSQSFTVSGSNLQGNVTITAPANFQIRTGTGLFSSAPIVLTPGGGNLATTTIDVRFVPTTPGTFSSAVGVSTPNGTGTVSNNVTVTGTSVAGPQGITVNPSTIDFGTVTSSGSASTQTFEVGGTGLSADIVLTSSSANIQFRNASAGGSFVSGPITLTQTSGTVALQVIEVRLVATVAPGPFSNTITASSTGSTSRVVTVTANNASGGTSDISVSNPDGNTFTFATRPNTVSVAQRFLVAGTNLVQDLTVGATGPNAGFFQVSKTGNTNDFFSTITFQRDAQNNVEQVPVFVRFVPGAQAITVTSTVRNSSAPAPNFDVSVTGISEPTIRLDQAIGGFPTNTVKLQQSAPVTVLLEGFLLDGNVELRFPADATDPVRNPAQTPQFKFSLDGGVTYVTSATITPDPATGNFSTALQVIFAPVRVGNANQELEFRTSSLSGGNFFTLTSQFGRATGFGIAIEPTAQSQATVVRTGNSATITFNLTNAPAGSQYGQNRLVIGSSTFLTTLPQNLFPQDKQNFNPGTTTNGAYNFGTGTEIGSGNDTYVVFSGNNNSFTVTNLDPAKSYKFFGFEFNNDGVLNAENYLVPNIEPQSPLPVELVTFTAKLRNRAVVLNWATASETNNRGFEVQRSQTGTEDSFTTILTKAGVGTTTVRTSYEATDAQPLAGLSYYRLKQIDLDGKTTTTRPVAIRTSLGDVSLFPNPTQGSVIIQLPEGSTDNLLVRIMDLTGRQIQTSRLNAAGQLNTDNLKSGTYIVIIGEGAQTVTKKLVKN
ncbi:T9SS type A sorting domain-containing protein [Hymenobacter fastidiosus]|uniref:T9SS type A sorting domain-containing protein n=1 Tax=Hymenobacter fastidiosus TaxID=486264 RepID=UPI0031EE8F06